MRWLVACLFVLVAAPAWAQLPASDPCTGAAAVMGGTWTPTTDTVQLVYTGAATCGGQASPQYQAALWNAATFNNDQYAEGVLADVGPGTGFFAGLGVRMTDGAGTDNFPGYYVFAGNNDPIWVQYCSNAAPSACPVIGQYSEIGFPGQTLMIAIVGTQILIELNGTPITCDSGSGCLAGVLTDATITSGSAGMASYNAGSLDSWGGGNYALSAGGLPVSSMSQLGAGR